ncbi:MAG: 23S rRNA (pseudouridine(1915)-N(3))-methyltransferase RlmH [Chitinophagaceae bacterium]|nr:23S rRNA (pseudouridine(1915)-N(3))-methyltransferase RlmH [Chitinophagaceae bacterium]MCW5906095.1 23S rRNA (pseudouridine(1915)-N(3))-methyltransferase RlmH [Chitinophagaceae bacterium]
MKIQLWSIGKQHEHYIKEGVADFTTRINKYFSAEWKIIAPPKNAASLNEQLTKKAEAQTIFSLLNKDDFLVLLDERGKQMTSEQLANFLQQQANVSTKNIIFLIGGAFGTDDALFKRANLVWSLSQLVFPHMLVRLILAEQLYRACTILKNEKYHHS